MQVAGHPDAQMRLLCKRSQRLLFGRLGLRVERVDISKLIHQQVGTLAVDVVCKTFKTAEHKSLTHHRQIAAQRIEQTHAIVERIHLQAVVVAYGSERIVHNLAISGGCQLLRHEVLQLICIVGRLAVGQRGMECLVKLHVVVAIDAQYVFHHVARAGNIHTVCRDAQCEHIVGFFFNLHLESGEDGLHQTLVESLADETRHVVERQLYRRTLNRRRVEIRDFTADFAACQLLHEQCGSLEGINHIVGIHATLKAERGIGVQALTARRLAHPCRMEASRLKEDVGCLFRNARFKSAEHAGDTHRLLCVANHKVAGCHRAFHTVESHEFRAFSGWAHHDFVAFHLCQVEAVQRLAISVKYEVCNVDHIVDWTLTDGCQIVAQPLRTFRHLHAADSQTGIADGSLLAFHLYRNRAVGTVAVESVDRRRMQVGLHALSLHPCGKVARHAEMRRSIDTVRSQVDFKHIVVLHVIVIFGESARLHRLRKLDDSVVRCADTDFVFGANHSERLDAADF